MGALFGLSYHLFSLGKVLIKSQTQQTLNDHQKIMKKFEGDFMKPNPRVTVKITISGKIGLPYLPQRNTVTDKYFSFQYFLRKCGNSLIVSSMPGFPPGPARRVPWFLQAEDLVSCLYCPESRNSAKTL